MSRSGINKVIVVGNVGQEPDIKQTTNGSTIVNLSIATSESWKDKNTGDQQERTEWHRVVFFNRLAEIVEKFVKKGSKVYIEGSLRTRKWQKDGQDRYTTEIVASEMQMLDSRGGATDEGGVKPHFQSAGGGQSSSQPANSSQSGFDDDIPF